MGGAWVEGADLIGRCGKGAGPGRGADPKCGNCRELPGNFPGKRGIPAQSCIIKRYCEKRFVSKYLATIGIDYGVTK